MSAPIPTFTISESGKSFTPTVITYDQDKRLYVYAYTAPYSYYSPTQALDAAKAIALHLDAVRSPKAVYNVYYKGTAGEDNRFISGCALRTGNDKRTIKNRIFHNCDLNVDGYRFVRCLFINGAPLDALDDVAQRYNVYEDCTVVGPIA